MHSFPKVLAILILAAIAKVVFSSHITLHDDEAYYWWWGHRLLPTYPAHPPGVAVFNAMALQLLGSFSTAPRLLATFSYFSLSVVTMLWAVTPVYFLADEKHAPQKKEKQTALRLASVIALLFVFVPHYYMLILIRTDTVMVLFATIAILASHLAVFYTDGATWKKRKAGVTCQRWLWIIAGVCWGIALVAKVTTGFLLLGYGLFFFVSPRGRKVWRQGFFYAHVAVAALFLAYYVWADSLYGFISLRTLVFRVQGDFSWQKFFAFHADQLVSFFPVWYFAFALVFLLASVYFLRIACVYFLFNLRRCWYFFRKKIGEKNFVNFVEDVEVEKQNTFFTKPFESNAKSSNKYFQYLYALFQRRTEEKLYFYLLSLPAMLYFIIKPFSQNQQANWTVFAPLGLMFLLALIIAERWQFKFWRRLFLSGAISVTFVYMFLLTSVFYSIIPAPGNPLCLYKKYESIPTRFAFFAKNHLNEEYLLASPDYKLASMVNLYSPLVKEAIILSIEKNAPSSIATTGSAFKMPVMHHTLSSLTLNINDVQGKLYFLAEVKLKNEDEELKKLEQNLQNSFAFHRYIAQFVSYCENALIAKFRLYEVENYRHKEYFIERK